MSKQIGHDMRTMERDYARWIAGPEEANKPQLERSTVASSENMLQMGSLER